MRISLLLPLLFASLSAKDFPYPGGMPEQAPEPLRAEWAERFERATTFRLFHEETLDRLAPFATAVPCHYVVTVRHADERVDGDSALAAILAAAIPRSADGPALRSACRDSSHGDKFDVWLDRGEDLVVASYYPASGSISFVDSKRRVAGGLLGSIGADLFALIAKRLPDDLRIDSIVPCAAEPETVTEEEQHRKYDESLPEMKSRIEPAYPPKARAEELEGKVMVQALIDTTGHIAQTKLLGSPSVFDESAVRAVEQWSFKPAKSNGRKVAVWVVMPVQFSIR